MIIENIYPDNIIVVSDKETVKQADKILDGFQVPDKKPVFIDIDDTFYSDIKDNIFIVPTFIITENGRIKGVISFLKDNLAATFSSLEESRVFAESFISLMELTGQIK